jgi:hypothetical protein
MKYNMHSTENILEQFKNELLKSPIRINEKERKGTIINFGKNKEVSNYKFISLINLVFWQDYYYLFYLSLKFIKLYEPNSNIISIGESPMKFIFTQSLFYDDPEIKKTCIENSFPTNLTFDYVPMSNLRNLYDDHVGLILKSPDIDFNNIIKWFDKVIDSDDLIKYLDYFIKFEIDPLSIISKKHNTIFVDKVETGSSIISFIKLYHEFIRMQQLNEVKIQLFLSKIKIIGYEGDYEDFYIENYTININKNIHKCIESWFEINDIEAKKMYKFEKIKIYNESKLYTHHVLDHIFRISNKLLFFTALPEHQMLGSRCIKSVNVVYNGDKVDKENIQIMLLFHV